MLMVYRETFRNRGMGIPLAPQEFITLSVIDLRLSDVGTILIKRMSDWNRGFSSLRRPSQLHNWRIGP